MTYTIKYPRIIQGGMGIGVSGWQLARAVAQAGQLGVVSGVGLDSLLVRRLQDADVGGHLRRAVAGFPIKETAATVLRRFFRPEGRQPGERYAHVPMPRADMSEAHQRIIMLASYAYVTLAKEGHNGPIGINLLTKIQIPTLATLYGALMAGVDYVLMGAGIPREIPGVLDKLAAHEPVSLRLDMLGPDDGEKEYIRFNPKDHWQPPEPLQRPRFFPIVSSNVLATALARRSNGRVDGFIVEGPTAGGHNAPPRGELRVNDKGEPVYGRRDEVDLEKIKALGLPFWLAGGQGSPGGLQQALAAGAQGIQVGTLFAYSDESGITEEIKRSVLAHALRGEVEVQTRLDASPTQYPFKVVEWEEHPARGVERQRICDIGYLRDAYRRPDGKIGYRCSAEPIDDFVRKGGDLAETAGKECLCNALMATVGAAQVRGDIEEPPVVTSGDDLVHIGKFLNGRERYSAADVVKYLLGED